jgi:hypothetical protein
MIFGWFKRNNTNDDPMSEVLYGESPVYNKEHGENMKLMQDILDKLDEIMTLVNEMKESENGSKSTGNR